jgi:hypothetical protein
MNTNTLLACTAVVIAFALVMAPLAIAGDAEAKHKKGDKKSNKATQIISQSQSSSQNSLVVSGGNSVLSGNNVNVQVQSNTGNNVLGQSNN